jgi:glycosyltransferase involved in cell wall biosynthesis
MTSVLIVNDWVSSIVAGGTFRIQGLAKGFNKLGFKVYITTPWGVIKYNRHGAIHQPNVGSPLYYATTGLVLPIQVIKAIMRSGSIDLALIQMPSPFTKALSILPVLRFIDVPVVLDFGDPWWKGSEPTLYKYLSTKLIQLQAEGSTLISASSKLILKLINAKTKVWIPNGVDTELFKPEIYINRFDGLIGFLGLFTRRNGSELIIPLLSELTRRGFNVKFLLVGGGDSLSMIRKEAIRKGLDKRILITNDVPRNYIPKLLSMCEILVAPYMESSVLHLIFPTKVPEMMALRRPVIAAYLYEIITTFKVNEEILVARYNALDYADKIVMLINNDNLKNKIAENGYRRIIRDFTWEKLAFKILKSLKYKQ